MIINLQADKDEWRGKGGGEADNAKANGICYQHVAMDGWQRPNDKSVENVLSMIKTSRVPVFVHCQHGCDRTGTIIACYRIEHDHWNSQDALREARMYGMSPLEIWMKGYVRDFEKSHKGEAR